MPDSLDFRYSYRDAPTIKAFSQSNAFIRGLMGPFRSGKSSGCVIEIVRRAQAQRPGPDGVKRTRWLVVRNTNRQLEDTTIKTFHQWLPPVHFGEYKATKHDYTILAMPGCHVEVMFRALDRPDHVSNLLSLEVTGAWINEAREVPWAIVEAIQGRVDQFPPKRDGGATWAGLFMDTNPPDSESKWYRFFEEGNHPHDFAKLFKQPSGLADNAENVGNLAAGRVYYERLAKGKSPEWVKVYIKGEYGFVIEGKGVYAADYHDGAHCSDDAEPQRGVAVYRGWDFGLTPACVFAQMQPGGRFVVFDEMVSESIGADRFSDEVLQHCGQAFRGDVEFIDVGDPAGANRSEADEKTCFQILQSKGIAIEPGMQTLQIRHESVRKPLNTFMGGRPQLQLHPRCKVLRKGFQGGYHYRRLQTTTERYSDKPEKNGFSHPHDALQYLATVIFGGGLTMPAPGRSDDDDDVLILDPTRDNVTGY